MSKILKGLQKMKLEEDLGLHVPVAETAAEMAERKEKRAEFLKSFAVKFNATAICLVIGIVVYHLGALLSGQNVTTHLIKEQRGEIAALTSELKAAQDRFTAQEHKINDLLSANKALGQEMRLRIDKSSADFGSDLRKMSVESARAQTGLLELKQDYRGVKEALRKLNKKLERLQTAAAVQQPQG